MATRRSKRTRRQARFAVLVGLFVFFAIQGVVAFLVEVRFPQWREPQMTARIERFHARTASQGADAKTVLFLGSSRFEYGIRGDELQPLLSETLHKPIVVFNYGVSGGNCLTSQRQWRRLHSSGARPSLVVVEVVPGTLHAECAGQDLSLASRPAAELDWADIESIQSRASARGDLYRENLVARAFPVYGHRLVITGRVVPKLQPRGHAREPETFQDTSSDPPAEKYAAALEHAHTEHAWCLAKFRLGAKNVKDVEALLSDLRSAGVPTMLLVAPEGPTFRSWYRPGAWNEIQATLIELCARNGATFVNAREWLDDDAFFDSHHLTVSGGHRFSARLAAEVLAPALKLGATTVATRR